MLGPLQFNVMARRGVQKQTRDDDDESEAWAQSRRPIRNKVTKLHTG